MTQSAISPVARTLGIDVTVTAVIDETPEARTIVLDFPAGTDYRPGQFITVRIPSDRTGPRRPQLLPVHGPERRRLPRRSPSNEPAAATVELVVRQRRTGIGAAYPPTVGRLHATVLGRTAVPLRGRQRGGDPR